MKRPVECLNARCETVKEGKKTKTRREKNRDTLSKIRQEITVREMRGITDWET